MKFFVGLGTFILVLWLNGPFMIALFLGFAAAIIVHFANKGNDEAGATVSQAQAAAEHATHDSRESVPDGNDPAALRAYLITLTMRVRALEKELHALKGAASGGPEAAPKPVQQATVHTRVP